MSDICSRACFNYLRIKVKWHISSKQQRKLCHVKKYTRLEKKRGHKAGTRNKWV